MRGLLALLLLTVALAQSPGTFFNPPAAVNNQQGFQSNPVWTVGQTQSIQWTTTYSNYTIELWQQVLGQGVALVGPSIFQTQTGAVTQFDWIVQAFQFDLNSSNVFLLWLLPGADGHGSGSSVTSHYFNITAATSSANSSLTLSTSNTLLYPTTTATPPSATSTSTDSNNSGGLTTGVKAGIGVGAVIGISAIAALGALAMWCLQRRRRLQAPQLQVQEGHTTKKPETEQAEPMPLSIYPVEIEGTRYPIELD